MLAIPLSKSSSTTISDLYGNAPFFAFLNTLTGEMTVEKNDGCGSGSDTAMFVKKSGATSTIFYHMGEGVFNTLYKEQVKVFTSKKNFLSIDEIYQNFLNEETIAVTKDNAKTLLDSGSASCTCGSKE